MAASDIAAPLARDRAAPLVVFAALDVFGSMGGMQRFNRRVVQALARLAEDGSHRVSVLALRDRARADDAPQAIADYRGFGFSRRRLITALAGVARARPAIVILGSVNFLPLAPIVRLLSPRTRIWLTVHGIEVWDRPPYRRRQPQDRFLLRRCVDRILSVSAFTAERMAEAFALDRDRFAILPNATDAAETPLPAWRKPAGPKRILAVTRLAATEREKNVDRLIDALHRLHREGESFHCTVVGDGPLRTELQAQIDRLGLGAVVELAGRVEQVRLDRLYADATAFVLPSKKEGFGIVFLEAWKAGVPVVGGNLDAAIEVIEDGVDGFLVDPDDDEAIARAIGRLLHDDDLARRFGAAGFAKVHARYTGAQFDANVRALVETALG
jgi:phosphatidylinositol alpha-1,6-mannosyltransferase